MLSTSLCMSVNRPAMDDPIDILQKRIEALELQILPKDDTITMERNFETITDLFLQTQTMISSALSCRESVTSILEKMERINTYLDPSHAESELEVEAKRQYLIELYPELSRSVQLARNFENFNPFIDSANIQKLINYAHKIDDLAISNLNIYEESRETTKNVVSALQQYNDITATIKVLFTQLEKTISDLESVLHKNVTMEE